MIKVACIPGLVVFLCAGLFAVPCRAEKENGATRFYIKGDSNNDLVEVLRERNIGCETTQNFAELARDATPGSPVLILADEYPDKPTRIPGEFWDQAKQKQLRVYVEFPSSLPGTRLSTPKQDEWNRLVVSSARFGGDLPMLQILVAHDCHFVEAACDAPLVVVGRVAGYNRAVFGVPKSAAPILFEAPRLNALVATTRLSGFASGRFAPHREWRALWNWVLNWLAPRAAVDIDWEPAVKPAYARDARLSQREESECFAAGVEWYLQSGMLVPRDRWPSLVESLKSGRESSAFVAAEKTPSDGTDGIMEGYSSKIRFDGLQDERIVLRADCNAESAMVLAVDWWAGKSERSRVVASNLLDFVYHRSGICGGGRGNPDHPAFGLIAWGAVAPQCSVANYGDDNARAILATMLAGACMNSDAWDEPLLKALHANLRTTGKLGFRGDRIDMSELERNGWRHYADANTVNLSPHFEAFPWACYLWAYRQTGYEPFLEKTKSAIRLTMDGFPARWRWNDNMERAHMLLCLAWLVRLEDTPEHRQWARTVALDLLSVQDETGGLTDRFRPSVASHIRIPASNEAYGTTETPLIQENGDPVTDQLYVGGFALLGLHEAATALNDAQIKSGEDRLASYLCRIQNRSKKYPILNGSWFRAFDYKRWETWASSADIGWGAWSVETGWGPAWTEAILGLRSKNMSFWELTAKSKIGIHEAEVMKLMSQNNGAPWDSKRSAESH
jgi:hypothetical protein